jgi:hypothetical protein
VTAKTSAGRPYQSVSRPRPRLLYQAGLDGVRYGAAHHPALAEVSYALFGPAGESARHGAYTDGSIPDELLEATRTEFGLVVWYACRIRGAGSEGPRDGMWVASRVVFAPGDMYAKCMQSPCHGSETGGRGRTSWYSGSVVAPAIMPDAGTG